MACEWICRSDEHRMFGATSREPTAVSGRPRRARRIGSGLVIAGDAGAGNGYLSVARWVKGIADAIADNVKAEHCDRDQKDRKEDQMRAVAEVLK